MPKQNRFQVQALADGQATIYIYGDIGYDFWAEESNDAKSFIEKLNSMDADEITVRINSVGGSVADATAIFNALRRHPARIITTNDGVAMSAASLIFMAGDERQAAANSLLMIHAPISGIWGNAEDMRTAAEMLDKYAEAMVSSYARSGMNESDVDSLLKDGEDHFYTADEALSDGFATEVTEAVEIAASGIKLDRFQPPAAWVAANHLKPEETTMPKQHQEPATTTQAAAEPVQEPVQAAAQPVQEPSQQPAQPAAQSKEQVLAAEKDRRERVRKVFEPFASRDGVQAVLDTALDDPQMSVQAAQDKLLKHLGSNAEPLAGDPRISVEATQGEKFVEAATNAVLMRTGVVKHESGNEFRGMTMMDMARASLDISGVNHRGMDKLEVVGAAMTHSTSDFPNLLEDIMHKVLLTAYRRREFTWRRFCKTGNLSDFRPHGRYRVGSFGNLDSKTENNEFKHKTLSDALKESIQLATKGNLITISREMIINDDMGALVELTQQMAYAAGRTIESAVYAYLATNPTMSDGKALFHADHGNLASSGASVTSALITAGKNAMASQQDHDGNDYLDIIPSVFVGNVGNADEATRINEMRYDDEAQKRQEKPNTNRGLFNDVVGSPRVAAPWYMFADPMDAPVLEVGFLDGNEDPYLEVKDNFTQDGATYKVRSDFAVGAVGWEGAFKNPGE
jgi:ATP-dependent protease ClpP protease subunit